MYRNFGVESSSMTVDEVTRDDLITDDYLRRIKTQLDSERYRQDSNDAVSVHRWVAKLRKLDCVIEYKQTHETHPNLNADAFVLIIQTPWQRRFFAESGKNVLCIDGTHNTQIYGYTLFTLLSRDQFGHGT